VEVKCLPCKQDVLNSEPQNPHEKPWEQEVGAGDIGDRWEQEVRGWGHWGQVGAEAHWWVPGSVKELLKKGVVERN
jgi:hypothetical protein